MKRFAWLFLILILVGCVNGNTPANTLTPAAGVTLPPPGVTLTSVPNVEEAATAFFDAWKAEDYASMYAMLTPLSQDAVSLEKFETFYKDTANAMTLANLVIEPLSFLTNPTTAQVSYRVIFQTALVGDLSRDTSMNLSLIDNVWRIQWEEGVLMPDLRGGNTLVLDVKAPSRGIIYDRDGNALATQMEAVALGIVPGQINPEREGTLVSQLSKLTGKTPKYIQSLYENAGPDWYIPVGEAPASEVNDNYDLLSSLSGLVMNYYTTRYYFDEGIGPHVTGYVQLIPVSELDDYKRQGYVGDEWVGRAGLEEYTEKDLAGQRAATLYVVDPKGQYLSRLGQIPSLPSQDVYTTLDANLQLQAQRAISDFRGAIVVMEVDSGRILAMASSPTMDPNLFDPSNYNSSWQLESMLNPDENRLLNRAAQSPYPLGSVFKIVSMAAALETGAFELDSSYNCGHSYTELEGVTLYDWTYTKEVAPSGELTLPEGLMRSCNPWFYHIGYEIYRLGRPAAIADMARGFGLGEATGLEGLPEIAGNIEDPATQFDSVQLAIGQGTMLVTPLQVADFIAAVANGGTLYRPQVIEKITTLDNVEVRSFKPEVRGTLPVSEETLTAIQEAMRSVVANRRGTAYYALAGIPVPVYGKTGTAQNVGSEAHAWFAGYTAANREGIPDVAIVVVAENAGEGSEIAA
ncbi:MAG: hypothetical protein HGA53_09135, partial [Anaerolineaceae bacterium]|nr:hypothetical protein [Anaerolineaceae bacterium]